MHKCIYCLVDKPKDEFNIEHVVSRMMGTYNDSYTLSTQQVCKDCNTVFSREIENKMGLDSLEGFYKIQKGTKKISDNHILKENRISFRGIHGKYENLQYEIYSDSSSPRGFNFRPKPQIGFLHNNKYYYFLADKFPIDINFNDKIFVSWGLTIEEVSDILHHKGYNSSKILSRTISIDPTPSELIDIEVTGEYDLIMKRYAAKTTFNYLCYQFGKSFVLEPKFNKIREFILYGNYRDSIKSSFTIGNINNIISSDNSHTIGLVWGDRSFIPLCGLVWWFNSIIYKVELGHLSGNSYTLPISEYSNITRNIKTRNEIYFLEDFGITW